MNGRRVHFTKGNITLHEGDYGKDPEQPNVWWVRPPRGHTGMIRHEPGVHWTITEHEDGTITASPSINMVGVWHGYLEHGVWKEIGA